eukprot:UN02920
MVDEDDDSADDADIEMGDEDDDEMGDEDDFDEDDFDEDDFDEDMMDYDDEEEEEEDDFDLENDIIEDRAALSKFLSWSYQTCGMNLIVTCYDSHQTALEKYPNLEANVRELQSAGATVIFGLDCTEMAEALTNADIVPASKFDHIVFNFPHVGSGEQDKAKSIAVRSE